MAQRIVKNYWQNIKDTEFKHMDYVPNSDGTGKLSFNGLEGSLDYKIRLSDDELKFKLSYDF